MLALMRSGSACNMACDYCYGDCGDGEDQLGLEDCLLLAERLREAALPEGEIEILWHGGEPSLLGPANFEKMIQTLNDRAGQVLRHLMQSNGLALSGAWPGLLRKYGVRVGISMDGPKSMHDIHRKSPKGEGTYDLIRENVKALVGEGVHVALLCTLGPQHAGEAEAIINWLEEMALPVKFNPLFAGGRCARPLPLGGYYALLREIFELALEKGVQTSIQPLEWMLQSVIHKIPPRECSYSGNCGKNIFALGKGGVVGKCTRTREALGNLKDSSLKEILERASSQAGARSRLLAETCAPCSARLYCNGGCPKSMGQEPSQTDCQAIREFYAWLSDAGLGLYLRSLVTRKKSASHTLARLKALAASLDQAHV